MQGGDALLLDAEGLGGALIEILVGAFVCGAKSLASLGGGRSTYISAMYGAREAILFLVLGSLERSSIVFSFIFSVSPISRRNIAINIILSINHQGTFH